MPIHCPIIAIILALGTQRSCWITPLFPFGHYLTVFGLHILLTTHTSVTIHGDLRTVRDKQSARTRITIIACTTIERQHGGMDVEDKAGVALGGEYERKGWVCRQMFPATFVECVQETINVVLDDKRGGGRTSPSRPATAMRVAAHCG